MWHFWLTIGSIGPLWASACLAADAPSRSPIGYDKTVLWELTQWELAAIAAALLLQAAILSWLLFERRRRRFAELESRGRLREVIHLNRVAAIGAMSASIAHELNQPLGAIMANTETAELLLATKPVDQEQLKEILADIRQLDQRAGDIIARLRGLLTKRRESELQVFELSDVISGALRLLELEAQKRGVQVSNHQLQWALPVRVDQVHLEQVILNLATNAMDAMQDCPPGTRRMKIETMLTGEYEVEVSMSDTGTGISKDRLQNIFLTFYTTKQQGAGLGLTVARTIIENCGGRIWAENRPEGGATFRFTLPLAKVKAA